VEVCTVCLKLPTDRATPALNDDYTGRPMHNQATAVAHSLIHLFCVCKINLV